MSYLMKIVLVGNSGAGKTSYLQNFCPKSFDPHYAATIGADFCLTDRVLRNLSIKFQIWDLVPLAKEGTIRSVFYYGALGAIVMFDVTDPESFAACDFWIEAIFKHNGKGVIPIILAGNKIDLRDSVDSADSLNFVSDSQALEFCDTLSKRTLEFGFSVQYFPVSAKTGINVSEVLDLLGNTYLDQI
ncbi:MAG: Rab family GTPase [Candidatus Hodarchaeales archaeon]